MLLSSFPAPPTTKRKQQSNPPKLTAHPTQSHPSTQREKQGKKLLSRERNLLFACFMAVLISWMSFASGVRELRGVLSMLETHIVMTSLISRLVLILVFHLARTLMLRLTLFHVLCLTILLVLCLSSLIDLTITHMVLVHKRTALSLDALVTAHILIMVIVSRVGLVFLLEGPSPTLSRDTCTVHTFSVVVHVPLSQVVRCKGL
jgi:flagellar biosynthesis protein FlhB